MGTRALFGFRKDGVDKAVYRHFDGYPEGLGSEFVSMLKQVGIDRMNEYFDRIECVDVEVPPTKAQIEYCNSMGWIDLSVSNCSTNDWYCLLRDLQYMNAWKKAIEQDKLVFIDNYIDFIKDSLFCEYAYIYDFDKDVLEYYEGFQTHSQLGNRYGIEPNRGGYFPCALKMILPKKFIEDSDEDKIVFAMTEYVMHEME